MLEDFFLDLRRRGYAERTLHNYRLTLRQFQQWMAEQQLHSVTDLGRQHLEQYHNYLMFRPTQWDRRSTPRLLTVRTRNRILSELKTFFRYLKRSGHLPVNLAAELELAKVPKKLPARVLSVPEVQRLLGAIPLDTLLGRRDRAMVEVLYGVGLRRSELMNLKLEDCWLDEPVLRIVGKGSNERMVPLGPAVLARLKDYLTEVRPHWAGGGVQHVWVSNHGGATNDQEFLKNLRAYGLSAGLKKRLHFHLFRHTCATHLLKGGADIRSIQLLLGHAKLDTTAIYTRVEMSDLLQVLRQCHPRELDPDALT
jgi:integrase/recombinase XerD